LKVLQVEGVGQVVDILRDQLRKGKSSEAVRSLAAQLSSPGDAVPSLYDAVKKSYHYTDDPPDGEKFVSAELQVTRYREKGRFEGDCDDVSILMACLIGSLGIDSRISLLDCDNDGLYDHAVASAYLGAEWYDVDLTSPNPLGWIEKYYRRIDIYG